MKIVRRILATALLPAVMSTSAHAQLSIVDTNSAYTINFDNTLLGVNNGAWAGTGLDLGATTVGFLDSGAWAIAGMSDGALEFGGTATTGDYARGLRDTPVTTGGLYAFGGGSIQGVALGFQPTGADMNPLGTITLRIQNTSALTIEGFTLDYVIHVRDDQPRSNFLNFSHSLDNQSFLAEPGVSYASTTATDITAPFVAVNRSISLSSLSLAPGGFYYLRWNTGDVSGSGNRDEFALDDIKLSAFDASGGIANYWDPTGTSAGLGGNGTWTGTAQLWNNNIAGTDPLVAPDPSRKMIFSGTAGTVTIGAGAVANAGIEATVDGYILAGGSLVLGGASPSIKVTNFGQALEITATLSGSAGLRKTGPGVLVLAGSNNYSGTTTIQQGTVIIDADENLGVAANAVALAGGTLQTTANIILDAARSLSGIGGLDIAASTTLTVPGATPFTSIALKNTGTLALTSATPNLGSVTFEQAAAITAPNGPATLSGNITTAHAADTATVSAALNLGALLRTVTVADGTASTDLRFAGNLTSTDVNGRLHKLGEGTLEMNGDNSGLLGGIRMGTSAAIPVAGGTLRIHNANGLGAGEFQFNAGTLHADSPNPLVFTNGISIGAGQLGDGAVFSGAPMEFTGSGSLFKASGTSFQHKITANTELKFSGGLNVSTGTGSSSGLTVVGTGIVILPNTTNTIAENITVDGGALRVDGGLIATPTITVLNGGVLSGLTNTGLDTGEKLGPVVLQADGTLNPGNAASATGTLDIGPFTQDGPGILHIDLGGTAIGSYDQISVTGAVTLGGELTLALSGAYIPTAGDTFTLILNDGVDDVTGTFLGKANDSSFTALGATFQIDYSGGDGNDVVLTVVPEPASAILLFGAGVLLVRRRRAGWLK